MPHGREPQQLECDLARWQSDGSGQGWFAGPGPVRQDRHRRRGPPPRACGTAPSVSGPAVLGTLRWQLPETPGRFSPPTVSAADGHGMILTGRRVDAEDATYRVARVGRAFDGLWVLRGERDDRLV